MDRKFLRPGWIVGHLLVVLAVLVCLRLGRWQWDRMHEGGTLQNLGYAVLWPVFGGAFVYMWFRFLQLEQLKDAEDDAELTALAAGDEPTSAQEGAAETVGPVDAPTVPAPSVAGEPALAPHLDLSSGPVRSKQTAASGDEPAHQGIDGGGEHPPVSAPIARVSRTTPSTGVTVGVATVGDESDDDPELAAYNRALAALAEKDHRRAR